MKKIECPNLKKVIRFALVALAVPIVFPYYEGAAEPPADSSYLEGSSGRKLYISRSGTC